MTIDPPATEPDFSSIRKVKPAFAGLLVDWTVGTKEIAATLIDLTVRGALYVQGTTLCLVQKNKCKPFEQTFIETIFKDKKSLSFDELKQIAFKESADKLLKILCNGAIEEGLVNVNYGKQAALAVKETTKELFGFYPILPTAGKPKIVYFNPDFFGILKNFKFAFLFAFLIALSLEVVGILASNAFLVLIGSLAMLFVLFLVFLLIPLGFFSIVLSGFTKKVEDKLSSENLLTENGKQLKKEVVALKQFMERFPMMEDRLANELVAFSISFGIGKNWIRKMGGFNAKQAEFYEQLEGSSKTFANLINYDVFLEELKRR